MFFLVASGRTTRRKPHFRQDDYVQKARNSRTGETRETLGKKKWRKLEQWKNGMVKTGECWKARCLWRCYEAFHVRLTGRKQGCGSVSIRFPIFVDYCG